MMMKVANGTVIRRLTIRFLGAGGARNIIVILAIALTATMFTSVFTIGGSMVAAVQDHTMRQVGTSAHAGLKYLTWEQYEDFTDSPLIKNISYNRFLAIAENDALGKLPSEIRFAEDKAAQWVFSLPTVGEMPASEDEIACSTLVLNALDVPHELGADVPLEFTVGDRKYSEHFILSGYWEGDPVMAAQQVWLSRGYVDALLADSVITDSYTGSFNADVWFDNSFDIEGKMVRLITERGYTEQEIDYGVNWAYSMSNTDIDPTLIVAAALILMLILLSGYLIIYAIFAISVTADIRFYGLLKTIGTTGRQIRRIVRGQAIVLSAAGIPLGLLLGFIVGTLLAPRMLTMMLLGREFSASPSPLIFVFAAVFSLLTVFIGCRKPSRVAARVSPVEAVRYEGSSTKGGRKARRTRKVSSLSMAWANITREKRKLVVIVLSLSLSLILLNSVFSATQSFDLDAYISDSIVGDFAVAERTVLNSIFVQEEFEGVTPELRNELSARGAVDIAGIYYQSDYEHSLSKTAYENFLEAVSALRPTIEREYLGTMPELERLIAERRLPTQVYGTGRLATESFYSDYDRLVSGDYALATTLLSGSSEYPIYAVGDMITLTNATGETRSFEILAVIENYPFSISTRWGYGVQQRIVLADTTFLDFYGERNAMQVNFKISREKLPGMEEWLANYTTEIDPEMDYASRDRLKAEFDGLKMTYLALGGSLSFILALIGVLNFINAIAASVIARRHELAVLQSIGMTGRQLRWTLFFEGACIVALAALFTLTIGLGLGLLITQTVAGQIWFFRQSFTVMPSVVCLIPLFLICAAASIICYSRLARTSLVKRLRVE
jgi:putative ABC transport system permease protein